MPQGSSQVSKTESEMGHRSIADRFDRALTGSDRGVSHADTLAAWAQQLLRAADKSAATSI